MFYFVGNPTYDTIVKDRNIVKSIGGSVVYASLIVKNLGYNAGIIGTSNEKIKDKISKLGIDTTYLYTTKKTTEFKNIYSGKERVQYAIKGEKILPEDIPEETLNSEGILLAPVLDEVDTDFTFPQRKTIFMVDISGFLRKVSNKGKIVLERNMKIVDLIRNSDIFKCNIREARIISDQYNVEDVCRVFSVNYDGVGIITAGREGSYVFHDNKIFNIPPYKTIEVDPTGSGDIYGTAFLVRYLERKNVLDAGIFASAAASYVVEGYGIKNIPNRNEIEHRVMVLKNSKNGFHTYDVSY